MQSVLESLPKPGDPRALHEPKADNELQEINPAFLRFDANERLAWRSIFFCAGIFWIVLFGSVFVPDYLDFLLGRQMIEFTLDSLAYLSLSIFFPGIGVLMAYFSVRAKLDPSIIVNRSKRQIYAWIPGKRWIALPYDRLNPVVLMQRVPNIGGVITVFRLQLQLRAAQDPQRVEQILNLGNPYPHPKHCGALWEFIRRYMDGPAEALPAVRLLPDLRKRGAWLAMADREKPFVDVHHRMTSAWGYVWFFAMQLVLYWPDQVAGWIYRVAPRRALPAEAKAAMQWQGPSLYKVQALTLEEKLALDGQLSQMRWRWTVAGLISTAFFGGLMWLAISSAVREVLEHEGPKNGQAVATVDQRPGPR
jgi:hypothetical protein